MTELKQALITGKDMSPTEADEAIEEMQNQVLEGEEPDEVLHDNGLEPDYVFDLLEGML